MCGKLRQLQQNGYPHKILTIALTNQWRFDNDPPFPPIAHFVSTWNRLGLKPAVQLTTVSHAMEQMETAMGDAAPEYVGEWTDWWANGTASAPREVAASRAAKRSVATAQSPVWGSLDPRIQATIDGMLRDLCLFDEHTWGSSLSVAQPYSLDTVGQFTEKSIRAYRPMAQAEWLVSQRAHRRFVPDGEGLLIANPTAGRFSGWVPMAASCLRDSYQSVEDPDSRERFKLYFEPGIEPWGRPRQPQDLTREDLSATFSDNAPNRAARFWVEQLPPHSVRRLRLSKSPVDDEPTASGTQPSVQADEWNWPRMITWPGMSTPLFLPGWGDFLSVGVQGFAPRWVLADIRGAGARREALRREKLSQVDATPAGNAEIKETPHTLVYTQAIRHPRLEWGTRILEVWKRSPRVRLTLRINRLPSAAPEIFYAALPLPTGDVLPQLSSGGEPFVPFTDQLPGTCRDYFAIDGWAAYDTPAGHWLWVSRDAPLISFGASPTLAFLSTPPPDVHRLQAMLFNNFWYTNFVGDSHGIMSFQFDLVWAPQHELPPADMAAALASEPVVIINPAAAEDPRLLERLYTP